MKLLVLNAGSGSQRCSLFEVSAPAWPAEPQEPVWEARLDATEPGQPPGKIIVRVRARGRSVNADAIDTGATVAARTDHLLRHLSDGPGAVLGRSEEIDAVGHRVVHGGDDFTAAARLTPAVESAIERLDALAPLHNANNLAGIRAARERLGPRVPAFAVFDTVFHRTLPAAASTYAGPYAWLAEKIRRYGFHGSSFRWAAARAARLLGRENDAGLRLIICHLGGGCSLCATRGGRSVDTTMGFTPLDGIAMCTRSGSVDPGILIHLQRRGSTADEIEKMLNKESGLQGLSGFTGDTRVLLPRVHAGDARARLAWDVFVHRLRAGIGAMLAALGDAPHALVFTDAISEDEPAIRTAACAAFGFLGVRLDERLNAGSPLDSDLAAADSRVRLLLIKSREAWQIASEVHGQLTARKSGDSTMEAESPTPRDAAPENT